MKRTTFDKVDLKVKRYSLGHVLTNVAGIAQAAISSAHTDGEKAIVAAVAITLMDSITGVEAGTEEFQRLVMPSLEFIIGHPEVFPKSILVEDTEG